MTKFSLGKKAGLVGRNRVQVVAGPLECLANGNLNVGEIVVAERPGSFVWDTQWLVVLGVGAGVIDVADQTTIAVNQVDSQGIIWNGGFCLTQAFVKNPAICFGVGRIQRTDVNPNIAFASPGAHAVNLKRGIGISNGVANLFASLVGRVDGCFVCNGFAIVLEPGSGNFEGVFTQTGRWGRLVERPERFQTATKLTSFFATLNPAMVLAVKGSHFVVDGTIFGSGLTISRKIVSRRFRRG